MTRSRNSSNATLRTFATSFLAASVGAAGGYAGARLLIDPSVLVVRPWLTGMYATTGAAVGVVGMRLAMLAYAMYADYFGSDT